MQALPRILIFSLLISPCGCGAKPDLPRPTVHPISGKIFVAGKPAAGARVTLYEKDPAEKGAYRPHGAVGADGIFRLTTFVTDDGAPDGEYALTVVWPLPPNKGQGEDEEGKDRFAGRYADYRRPPAQVKISAETRELAPLNLK